MSEYQLLLACWLSGQISPAQWLEHLKDPDFAAWLEARRSL